MSKWQPIETAPRNVGILVTDGVIVTVCELYYCTNYPSKAIRTDMAPVGWGGYEWEFEIQLDELTNWMPLPNLPNEADE